MSSYSSVAFESGEHFDRLASRLEKLSPDKRESLLAELCAAGEPADLLGELRAFACGLPDITKRLPGTRIGEGTSLGRYHLIECIGRGGMGVVYRARHEIMKREVAIKLIRPDLLSIDRMHHFLDEVRNLAQLNHPNIIAIHDADVFVDSETDKLVPFYVMPLIIDGQAVSEYCTHLAPLERLRLFAKLCDAVAYCHSQHQLVHLDLKPANVLIDTNGELHVIDFGVGKILQPVIDRPSHRVIGGTLAYMSPEQMMAGKIGPWSDQYALGVILYQLLTGQRPYQVPVLSVSESFSRSALLEVIGRAERAIVTSTPVPLEKFSPQFKGALNRIVAKVLQKSPARRFRSVDALRNEIQSYMETETRRLNKGRIYRDRLLKKVNHYCERMLDTSFLAETLRSLSIRVDQVSVPWSVDIEEPGKTCRSVPISDPLVDIFDKLDVSEGIVLLGEAGAGKTTTLLHLARGLAARALGNSDYPLPVVLLLSRWKDSAQPIEHLLVKALETEYLIPSEVAWTWLSSESLAILIDDLDRVAPSQLEVCIRAINDFRREHFMPIILCARTATILKLPVPIRLNTTVRIEPLSETQVADHISRLGPKLAGLKSRIEGDPHLSQLGSSPLLLSIMTVVLQQQNAIALRSAPFGDDRRKKVFDVYLRYKIGRNSRWEFSPERIMRWLQWLAEMMYQHDESDFRMERMQPAWLPSSFEQRFVTGGAKGLIGCGIGLIFGVIDEYYGGPLGIGTGLAMLAGFVGGLFVDVSFKFTRVVRPVEWLPNWFWTVVPRFLKTIFNTVVSVSVGLGMAIVATKVLAPSANWIAIGGFLSVFMGTSLGLAYALDKQPALRTVPRKPVRSRIILWVLICVICGGIVMWFPDHWISLLDWSFTNIMITGLLAGLLLGVTALLSTVDASLDVVPDEERRPNGGIWRSFQSGLLSMAIIGGIVGLGVSLWFGLHNNMTEGLILGAWMGLLLGFSVGAINGFCVCVQHMLLRIILWLRDYAPLLRYASFLDYADKKLGLLRQYNGKFSFYHPLLMDYFAELTPAKIRRLAREINEDGAQ